jgi:hypothetical protein
MNLKALLVFSVLIGLGISVGWAQQSEFIYGKIIDAETKEPVSFATIRIQNKAIGVISNDDGGFAIPFKFKEIGEILEITSMGFMEQKILISELASEEVNIIMLFPKTIELQEVIVTNRKKRRLSAKRIVKKAIDAILENYPLYSFSTVGYYRDYQKKQNQYINLNEAILGVFDEGFDESDNESTAIRIYDYRENGDFDRDTIAQKPYNYKTGLKVIDKAFLRNYGGNEFTILRIHDALRNYDIDSYSFVHRLKYDFIENHSFSKGADTYLASESLYKIRFRKVEPRYLAYGTLYISQRDFAIHKMEYALYDKLKTTPANNRNKNVTKGQLIFEVITEYQRVDNKMFLNYISFNNSFRLREPPKFKVEEMLMDFKKLCFVVVFNKEPQKQSAVINNNYSLIYKGKKLKLKEIVMIKKQAYIYPNFSNVDQTLSFFRELNTSLNKDSMIDTKLFSFTAKNIIDMEGNKINSPSYIYFNQFREFFVQQVKPNTTGPMDNLYMKKDRPIFKNQPIVKPDDFSELWMNTPLKTIDN